MRMSGRLQKQFCIRNQPSGRQSHTKPVSNIKTDVLALLDFSQSRRAQGRLRTERYLPGTNPQMAPSLTGPLNALIPLLALKYLYVKHFLIYAYV